MRKILRWLDRWIAPSTCRIPPAPNEPPADDGHHQWLADLLNELKTPSTEAEFAAADFDLAAKRGRDFARHLRNTQPD